MVYGVSYEEGEFLCCDWYDTEEEAIAASAKVKGEFTVVARTTVRVPGALPQYEDEMLAKGSN